MGRYRVLIVEDRPSVLKLMATILGDGYDVTSATDGETALRLIESEDFDVVLTDIRMPGATGFEVLRAVKDRAPNSCVVMITAYANVADAVAAIKLGAYDYVAKPLDADEIKLVLARAIEHLGDAAAGAPRATSPHFTPREVSQDLLPGFRRTVEAARDRASREYLAKLMCSFGGNVTHAAKRAGMTRESLHRVLKKYGVRADSRSELALPPPGDPRARRNG